jgi:hypothetical protein
VLDSLKSFGLSDRHDDRYHPTLTAVNGLRDYAWTKRALVFPELGPELRRWARGRPSPIGSY